MKPILRIALVVGAVALAGESAQAQQTVSRSGAKSDWSVFEGGAGEERVCWVLSTPKSMDARRNGRSVRVNRGDVYLLVGVWPGLDVENEISTVIGYTFREDSSVEVRIGSDTFSMNVVDGDKAWLQGPEADARMVDAMRRGSTARVTGVSSRGTTTIDTYSLIGFTAALQDARALCS